MDLNHHQTYITAPHGSAQIEREAIPPDSQVKVVIPAPSDRQSGLFPNGDAAARHRDKLYGMALAWRGLHLLGVTIGIAVIWFVIAWVRHDTVPLGLVESEVRMAMGGNPASPILPPTWLVAVLGLLTLISLFMMLMGTQDANPRIRFGKKRSPSEPAEAISNAKPGAGISPRGG